MPYLQYTAVITKEMDIYSCIYHPYIVIYRQTQTMLFITFV